MTQLYKAKIPKIRVAVISTQFSTQLTPEVALWSEMNEAFLKRSGLWRLVCKQYVQNM